MLLSGAGRGMERGKPRGGHRSLSPELQAKDEVHESEGPMNDGSHFEGMLARLALLSKPMMCLQDTRERMNGRQGPPPGHYLGIFNHDWCGEEGHGTQSA